MTTALVTGAAGFFGQAIVSALACRGCDVVATDRVDPAAFPLRYGTPPERVTYVQRDLVDEGVDGIINDVEGIVHAAALTLPDDPDGACDMLLQVNVGPLPGLLSSVRGAPSCRRLVLISSAGVYDQAPERTLREADASGGRNLYGASKFAGELIASRYCAIHGIAYTAVRPTSLFGPGERERPSRPSVSPLVRAVECALSGVPVRIERGSARRDWLSVDDAADAVATLWVEPELDGRAYNLSSGRTRPFDDVVAAVVRATGLQVDPDSDTVVDGGPDRAAVVDSGALAERLGWQATRSLDDGIRDVVADIRRGASACST